MGEDAVHHSLMGEHAVHYSLMGEDAVHYSLMEEDAVHPLPPGEGWGEGTRTKDHFCKTTA